MGSKSTVTPQEKMALPIALKNLLTLYRAGVLIALGTDAGASPIRAQGFSEHMEMALMVRAGLTPLEAIKIATLNGARLLGIETDQGSLEKGKKADFIVLDKDPLTDIHNTLSIDAVWKDGIKVSDGPLTRH
jgi:imidazolonepropionase-like amidohydrolase